MIASAADLKDRMAELVGNAVASLTAYELRHLAEHLLGAEWPDDLLFLVESQDWYYTHQNHDPSLQGYVRDLDLAFNVAASQGSDEWSHLVANTLLRATLIAVAGYLPVEVYETLVRVTRGQEALQRARTIPDEDKRVRALKSIRDTTKQLNRLDLFEQAQKELAELPLDNDTDQPEVEDGWLVDFVDNYGARRALHSLLMTGTAPDPDNSQAVKWYIEVAAASFALGRVEEVRELLLECLDLTGSMWDQERQPALIQIARLLLDMGYDEDLELVIELMQRIEHEHYRLFGLSELALVCCFASDLMIAERCIELAVTEIRSAVRTSTLQFEMSKIALAMSRIADKRAEELLDEAIQLAQRPTQAAWHWEEQRAWLHLAAVLASIGLCDEALTLASEKGGPELDEGEVAVELAVQGRWHEAWQLGEGYHPTVRRHTLVDIAQALAQRDKLEGERYEAIIAVLTQYAKDAENPRDRIERIGQLVAVALLAQKEQQAGQYLARMTEALGEADPVGIESTIRQVLRYAAQLRDIDTVCALAIEAQNLPEDSQRGSRSAAIAVVAATLADLGEIEGGWSLADKIEEDWKRLETYVCISESTFRQEKPLERYFNNALQLALQVGNVGWVPGLWGRLGVLASHLGRETEEAQCIQHAIDGTYAVAPGYEINFNVYNSASVARSLHSLGLSSQALTLLKHGLSVVQATDFRIDPLRCLVQTVISIRAESLWSNVLEVAQAVKSPSHKAEALLGIASGIGYLGDRDRAMNLLPSVLSAILGLDENQHIALEFGSFLSELFDTEDTVLQAMITEALARGRMKGRPAALTWLAAFIPVMERIKPAVAFAAWCKIQQAEAMLSAKTDQIP